MSLLFRESPRPLERSTVRLPPGFGDQYPDLIRQMRGSSGVYVDGNSAMEHPTFWSCVTKIAQDVSMMPADVVRYVDGTRQPVEPTPQIIANPSVFHMALDWRYQVIESWLTAGDAWGIVTDTTANFLYPTRIELKNVASIRIQMTGQKVQFFVDNEEHQLWPVGDLWHVAAYTQPGSLLGMSPIEKHARTIGKGLAAEKYGLQFFTDGAHPTWIWKLPGKPDDIQLKGFKQRLIELTRGNREPLITGLETVGEKIQTDPKDSQFIETEQWSANQICQVFGEDPVDHGLAAGVGSVSYANRMDADLARYKRRQFWVTKLQDVLTSLLPSPNVVKLNTSVALMMTDKERHEIHKLRLESRTRTINEVRKIEDEKLFKGDEYDLPGIPDGTADQAEVERQALILQKMYLAVGVVITEEEARELANKAGMDLGTYDPALLGHRPAAPGGSNP